ncbi:hypothetical protein ACTG4Q_20910 [Bradyrhizobium denitrificans]
MRLYSITDFSHLVQQLLHGSNFATIPIKRGQFEAVQVDRSGRVSQRFLITIETSDRDPV